MNNADLKRLQRTILTLDTNTSIDDLNELYDALSSIYEARKDDDEMDLFQIALCWTIHYRKTVTRTTLYNKLDRQLQQLTSNKLTREARGSKFKGIPLD